MDAVHKQMMGVLQSVDGIGAGVIFDHVIECGVELAAIIKII